MIDRSSPFILAEVADSRRRNPQTDRLSAGGRALRTRRANRGSTEEVLPMKVLVVPTLIGMGAMYVAVTGGMFVNPALRAMDATKGRRR